MTKHCRLMPWAGCRTALLLALTLAGNTPLAAQRADPVRVPFDPAQDKPWVAPFSLAEKSRDGDVYSRDVNRILCRAATRYGGEPEEWLGTRLGVKCAARGRAPKGYGYAQGLPGGRVVEMVADGSDVAAVVLSDSGTWNVCRLDRRSDRWQTLLTLRFDPYSRPSYRHGDPQRPIESLVHPQLILTPTRLIVFPDVLQKVLISPASKRNAAVACVFWSASQAVTAGPQPCQAILPLRLPPGAPRAGAKAGDTAWQRVIIRPLRFLQK